MFDTLNGNVIVNIFFVYLLIVHGTAAIATMYDMIEHKIVEEEISC